MEYMHRFDIKMRLAFAVAVYDSFSGKQLTGSSVKITVPDDLNKKPVVKPDGYYVMLEGETPVKSVSVESYGFHTRIIDADYELLSRTGKVLTVWLTPDRSYPVRSGATFIEGTALPGETVDVVCKSLSSQIKLLVEYKASNEDITLFLSSYKNLIGRAFAVFKGADSSEYNRVTLLSETDVNGKYLIDTPLDSNYKKQETFIFPLVSVKADENGKFYALLKIEDKKDQVTCVMRTEERRDSTHVVTIDKEKNNYIDLI